MAVDNELLGSYAAGAAPLTADDLDGLIPRDYITTQEQLNQWEQANITKALGWLSGVKRDCLADSFVYELHRRMFDDTWEWAGARRLRETNVGCDPNHILTNVRQLVDNARHWIDRGTYEPYEAVARYSHKMVTIHPFRNGNGRHSRLIGDCLAMTLGITVPTWGGGQNLSLEGPLRQQYLAALRKADVNDYTDLLGFAWS